MSARETPARASGTGTQPSSSAAAESVATQQQKDEPGVEDVPATTGPEEEEEPDVECAFCVYMKGGGCKDAFIAWEKCVDEAREAGQDFPVKCMELTNSLHKCMAASENYDYYKPMLEEEDKYAEEQKGKDAHNQESAVEVPSPSGKRHGVDPGGNN